VQVVSEVRNLPGARQAFNAQGFRHEWNSHYFAKLSAHFCLFKAVFQQDLSE
jgi:hypothetical protein